MSEHVTFSFGANWLNYIEQFDQEKFRESRQSLVDLLQTEDLTGQSFLDIGCGSGIFSLAAFDLGATAVTSIDVDPNSIAACTTIRDRFAPESVNWTIREGSVLDLEFVQNLPQTDVVYSWGVLHHTGEMWPAIANAATRVKPGGRFIIAIYNETTTSEFWLAYKRLYNRAPELIKKGLVWAYFAPRVLIRFLKGKAPLKDRRGMSVYYDAVDWVGGLPYEYASVAAIDQFCIEHGFERQFLIPTNGVGCNQFVYRKAA